MANFLLKIIDNNGKEVWNDKFKLGYVHLDSFRKFADLNNLNISLSTDEEAALSLVAINYITILNLKIGYLLYLPELCSREQIDYLKNILLFLKADEVNDKIIEVAIYSKEPLYYNHKNYRDLKIEEEIDILEGRKKSNTLVTVLLEEELEKQKEINKKTTIQF